LKYLYNILIFIASYNVTYSQNWITYNQNNSSLANSGGIGAHVSDIKFDSQGNIWMINGDAGVVKYDGTNWTNFTISNSNIPSNSIRRIFIDSNDDIWLACQLEGLGYFDGTNWSVYNTTNSNISSNQIRAIQGDNDGNIYVATKDNGVCVFDGTNWTNYNNSTVSSTYAYDGSQALFTKIDDIEFSCADHNFMANNGCKMYLHEANNNELVILNFDNTATVYGSSDGLNGYSHEFACNGGPLYIGSELEGLFILKDNPIGGDAFYNYNNSNSDLLNSTHFDIHIDTEDPNYLWIASVKYGGSDPGGVEKVFIGNSSTDSIFDNPTEIYYIGNSDLSSNDVRCVANNGCDKWFGLVGAFDDGGVTLNSCNTISSSMNKSNTIGNINIYPNPANESFVISNIDYGTIELYDILGKKIIRRNLTSENQIIDISDLIPNIYFIKIFNDKIVLLQKLIIK
jgi:hypothetical protein